MKEYYSCHNFYFVTLQMNLHLVLLAILSSQPPVSLQIMIVTFQFPIYYNIVVKNISTAILNDAYEQALI